MRYIHVFNYFKKQSRIATKIKTRRSNEFHVILMGSNQYKLREEMSSSFASIYSRFPFENWLNASTLTFSLKNRYAHTDLPKVSFQEYRRKSLQNSNVSTKRSIDQRKTSSYVMSFGTFSRVRGL